MKRRATDSGDSLELLLDTICNMFGCIVFIAMFLFLALGDGTESLARNAAGMGADEAIAAQAQLAELNRRLDRTTETLDQLRSGVPSSERDRITADAALAAQLENDILLAEARLKQSAAINEQVSGRQKNIAEKLADAKSRRADLEREKEELQTELKHQNAMRIGSARLPVERKANNFDRELMVIVQGGHAYAWLQSQWDKATMVQITPKGDGFIVKPILGRGIRVTDAIGSDPRWSSIVSQINGKRQTAYLMVYPNSVAAFIQLRVDLLKNNILLKLDAMPADTVITLGPSENTTD